MSLLKIGVFIMGVWSSSLLGNDDVIDFFTELQESKSPYEEINWALNDYIDFIDREERGVPHVLSKEDFQKEKDELILLAKQRLQEKSTLLTIGDDYDPGAIDAIYKLEIDYFNESIDDYIWFAIAACESLAGLLGRPSEEFLDYYGEDMLKKTIEEHVTLKKQLRIILPITLKIVENIVEKGKESRLGQDGNSQEFNKNIKDLLSRLNSIQN